MVTLNSTLIVELVLFLVFLWGTSRFIIRPVLRQVDDREHAIESDTEAARANLKEAKSLDEKYQKESIRIRRAADEIVRKHRQEALREHADRITVARRDADDEVARFREEMAKSIADQADTIKSEAPAIAESMAKALKIGGPQS